MRAFQELSSILPGLIIAGWMAGNHAKQLDGFLRLSYL
jgi:hypothetical protein